MKRSLFAPGWDSSDSGTWEIQGLRGVWLLLNFPLTVYDHNEAKAAELAALGVKVASESCQVGERGGCHFVESCR